MPYFFIVLLKINLVLILFSAVYYLVLRKLTFYALNRAFLIFGIVFSSAYPFINLTDFFARHQAVQSFVPQFNQNIQQLVVQHTVSVFWQALLALFYFGVLLMAIRLLFQFVSLRKMHANSKPGFLNGFNVRFLTDHVSPFSFWQTIYINPALHKDQDLGNILEHEKVHVDEWHTLDILLAEICVVFYWFNPGVWLMKKAIRENIEFITDSKILRRGADKKAYQYSLLDVGCLQPSVAIVNNFNLSDLKKRINMMNAKRSSKINLTRYMLALPVLLFITLAFTVDKKTISNQIKNIESLPQNSKELAMSLFTPETTQQVTTAPKQPTKSFAKLNGDILAASVAVVPNNNKELQIDSLSLKPKTMPIVRGVGFRIINLSSDSVTNNLDKNVEVIARAGSKQKFIVGVEKALPNIDSVVLVSDRNGESAAKLERINPEDVKRITVTVTGVKKVMRIETKDAAKN